VRAASIILAEVAPRTGTGERQGYATAVAELWTNLARTLARLDDVAGQPEPNALASLPSLQYRLHEAIELLAGIDPPTGAEEAHAELVSALEDARDLTGEVLACGDVVGFLHQWRAALFRVRLARSQLFLPRAQPAAPAEDEAVEGVGVSLVAPLASVTLILLALVAFLVAGLFGPWLLWTAGLVLLAAALLVYRS
jgi:hypothetical protein